MLANDYHWCIAGDKRLAASAPPTAGKYSASFKCSIEKNCIIKEHSYHGDKYDVETQQVFTRARTTSLPSPSRSVVASSSSTLVLRSTMTASRYRVAALTSATRSTRCPTIPSPGVPCSAPCTPCLALSTRAATRGLTAATWASCPGCASNSKLGCTILWLYSPSTVDTHTWAHICNNT